MRLNNSVKRTFMSRRNIFSTRSLQRLIPFAYLKDVRRS
ncbi:MAG: hypothetical protein JWL59_4658 [Chthoniobacteraceae bacterium]|nr:hypothetical protein [Chthoniobacteraceae bacterium]